VLPRCPRFDQPSKASAEFALSQPSLETM
jgi:hypothetical protein